jgi:hypothetical protein
MKIKPAYSAAALWALLAGIVVSPMGLLARAASGQSFVSSGAPSGLDGTPGALPAPPPAGTDAPDSSLCAQGKQAIDQSRWADAIKIFTQVIAQHGEHADKAIYWKAYAEYELGQSKPSENTCAELRANYPKSRWVEDCGALEVEIRARTGKPVVIDPAASDDVKLLALNAMLRQNEPQALAEIQQILNGDSSEKLKKEAEFILGHHYSDTTYAQVVRISYVEGDVRIQRGEPNGKASAGEWEKAVTDLPLDTGYSLVTGQGRAEIEFENASTMYLGENSVLTFNDLHETAGIPYTELALLTGTASLHIHPYLAGERFVLHTPTNDFVAKFPDRSYARIQAYTDAVAITPLEGKELHLPGVPKDEIQPGRTWTYLQGQLWTEKSTNSDPDFAEWDKWVADRVAQRDAADSAVMASSGLTEPIPGMAEMQGQGKFFECAPYGTCWEPNEDASTEDQGKDEQSVNQRLSRPANQQPHLELAAYHPNALPAQAAQTAGQARAAAAAIPEYRFPCTPAALLYRSLKDPVTGKTTVIAGPLVQNRPYDWAVCHAGSWIRHRRHYAWVAGGKRHHVPPVRWVKSGRAIAFVPIHPYDVKGQPAVNARHEVFAVNGRNPVTVEPMRFEPSLPIEYLKDPPKEFRTAALRPLTVAEVPHMEAHPFAYRQGAKGVDLSRAAVPIHFDAKSQSFLVAREEIRGGKSATVFAPMSNHSGTLQAHAGSFPGGSGFHGTTSSGSRGASASAGGGSRGGGGSSGGGGSHGGGGSTASSSSASSSASSGGSHH